MVCLYVDDMIYACSSNFMIDEFKAQMMAAFDKTYLGNLKYFLGLEIKQEENGIFFSQEMYARMLLKRFGMVLFNPVLTLLNCTDKFVKNDGETTTNVISYRSLVGGLIYLTHSIPDNAFALSNISRFIEKPSQIHFLAAKRILRYIAGTVGYGIWYSKKIEVSCDGMLYGYSDADFTKCEDDSKSISAYSFTLGSEAIVWSSKKQSINALSSTKSEYIEVTFVTYQAVWIKLFSVSFSINKRHKRLFFVIIDPQYLFLKILHSTTR